MTTKEIIAEVLANKKASGTPVDSVFFVGCGGSFAAAFPAFYFLGHESKTLKTAMFTSNEFVHAAPRACGASSIVIACSMRGTAETGEAVKTANSLGATTIGLYVQESEMTRACCYCVPYCSVAEDSNPIQTSNAAIFMQLAAEILFQAEGYEHFDQFMSALAKLDNIYRRAKEESKAPAEKFGKTCKDDEIIYVMGAGPSTGAAYIFSICNLMEMQWIHSPTVNFGELLHGPFETVDKNLPIVCLVSTGRTRPVDERAMRFLRQYGGERLFVLDAQELGLAELDESVGEYFCPLIFSSLLQNVYLHAIADAKQHPITTRRYMWKVDY